MIRRIINIYVGGGLGKKGQAVESAIRHSFHFFLSCVANFLASGGRKICSGPKKVNMT
jgi:hypothetical protein